MPAAALRLLTVVLLVALAGCGGDDDGGGADDGGPATFEGELIVLPDGSATLCQGPIMESAPPRCAEPFLVVEGLDDPASVPGVVDLGGWLQGPVTLRGESDGTVLRVS